MKLLGKCVAGAMLAVLMAPQVRADHDLFKDYKALVAPVTADMLEYAKTHPQNSVDSIEGNLIKQLCVAEGSVGRADQLTPARKRKLSAEKIYELCSPSSLVYGVMEYSRELGVDTAYTNASAVALTKDGICATNYHVVADMVLRGAMQYKVAGDKLRFVMDRDGKVYPLTDILYVDPVNDFSIIKVDTRGAELTPAAIGGDCVPGTRVYCLSHPSGAYYNFTEGIVSNCKRDLNRRSNRIRYNMEITADYGVGASGGPIFDECGNLVALVSSTYSLYANQQQNFQMAYKQTVPVFLIKECFTSKK